MHALKPFNYDHIASFYDAVEASSELNSTILNNLISRFKEHGVSRVWDCACGTGNQAVGLAESGFKVTASDLSDQMLDMAKDKTESKNISFHQADLTDFRIKAVDAAIAITNVLLHFTEDQLISSFKNIHCNLKPGGLFIADFDNRAFLETPDIIPKGHYLSGEGIIDEKPAHRLTLAENLGEGLFLMNDRWIVEKQTLHEASWHLKSWYKSEIENLLEDSGFKVFEWTSREFETLDLSDISKYYSLLFVAQKQ